MLRFIALVAVTAACPSRPVLADAQTGYGVKPGAPSTSSFDRHWNRPTRARTVRGPERSICVSVAWGRITIITPPVIPCSEVNA